MVKFLAWGVAHPQAKAQAKDPHSTNYTVAELRKLAERYGGKPIRLVHAPENVGDVIVSWVNEDKRRLEALFSIEGPTLSHHLAASAVANGYYTGLSIGSEMGLDFDTFEIKKDRPPVELSLCPLRLAKRGEECRILWSNAGRTSQSGPPINPKPDKPLPDSVSRKLLQMSELKKLIEKAESAVEQPAPVPAATPSAAAASQLDDASKKQLEELIREKQERERKKEEKAKKRLEEERQARLKKAQMIISTARASAAEQADINPDGAKAATRMADLIESKIKANGDISAEDLDGHEASITFIHTASQTMCNVLEKVANENKRLRTEKSALEAQRQQEQEEREKARQRLESRRGEDISSRLKPSDVPAVLPPVPAPAPVPSPASTTPSEPTRMKRILDELRANEISSAVDNKKPKAEEPAAAAPAPAAVPAAAPAPAAKQQSGPVQSSRPDAPQLLTDVAIHAKYSRDLPVDLSKITAPPPVPVIPPPRRDERGQVLVPPVRPIRGGGGLQEQDPDFYRFVKSGLNTFHEGLDKIDLPELTGKVWFGRGELPANDTSGNWSASRQPEPLSFVSRPATQPAAAAAAPKPSAAPRVQRVGV